MSDNNLKNAQHHPSMAAAAALAQQQNYQSAMSSNFSHLLGLNGQIGMNSQLMGAQGIHQMLAARKEPALSIDYSHMAASNAMAAQALAGQASLSFYPGLQGQPLFNGDRLGLQSPYGTFGSLAASSLATMPHSNLTLRQVVSPIKRPFPDAGAALTDWDKRPKFF
jgi:hypothetical protein